jgi:hypothetical protein
MMLDPPELVRLWPAAFPVSHDLERKPVTGF